MMGVVWKCDWGMELVQRLGTDTASRLRDEKVVVVVVVVVWDENDERCTIALRRGDLSILFRTGRWNGSMDRDTSAPATGLLLVSDPSRLYVVPVGLPLDRSRICWDFIIEIGGWSLTAWAW